VIALAVVIVVVGGVRAFRQGELRFDRIDPQQGTRIYQRNCAECHGADAEGKDRAQRKKDDANRGRLVYTH